MLSQKSGGAIVNTHPPADGLAWHAGLRRLKHAVLGYEDGLRPERAGIRVNAVCPARSTPHDPGPAKQLNPSGKVAATYQASIPIGRYGTAEEVAIRC